MISRLKELRQESEISQKMLADIIHVSQQSINKYENHEVEPNIETLCMIADYFNTSIDYLVGHTNIKRRYEQVNESHLNSDEQIIVDCYRRLSKKDKDILAVLINRLTQKQ